jgi:glycosyltransferase involved in cell wall biosynthesis
LDGEKEMPCKLSKNSNLAASTLPDTIMQQHRAIAFVCHPYHRGGVTRWMADAAIHTANSGWKVYFVTVSPRKPFKNAGGRETMQELLAPYKNKLALISEEAGYEFEFGTERYRAYIYSKLLQANVPEGAAVIASDDSATWAAVADVADKYKMIGVLHGDQTYYYDIAGKYAMQLSAAICVSGRTKKTLATKYPSISTDKTFMIPCGIALPKVNRNTNNSGVTRLIFVGRLSDYEKRAYDLVTICSALKGKKVNFRLDIVGNSEESKIEYTVLFDKKGVGENISFHGWQPATKVQKLLSESDILLLTSNSEGMPLVMMEALASGCGFLGTRVSGIEDFEQHRYAEKCFAVYTIGDVMDAANKIVVLSNIPVAERETAAVELATTEFGMEVCMTRYQEAIDKTASVVMKPAKLNMGTIEKMKSRLRAVVRNVKMSLK